MTRCKVGSDERVFRRRVATSGMIALARVKAVVYSVGEVCPNMEILGCCHPYLDILLGTFPYLGSASGVFNIQVLRSCASSILTPFSFMSFLITSDHLSFSLSIFRYPSTFMFHVLITPFPSVFLSTWPSHFEAVLRFTVPRIAKRRHPSKHNIGFSTGALTN